jgi:hypothetical protein
MLTNSNLLNFIGLYDFDIKAGCGGVEHGICFSGL